MTDLSSLRKYYSTDDADAVAGDVIYGKTAYVNGGKVIGTAGGQALLLFHVFDGANGVNVGGTKPLYCYDQTSAFSGTGFTTNGSGYLVNSASNTLFLDAGSRWPDRTGKVRNYKVWGYNASPTTNDYFPTLWINYVDANNFWSNRAHVNASSYYSQMYEWISGGVGEGVRQSSTVYATSGQCDIILDVQDYGEMVSLSVQCIDESAKSSDSTVNQPNKIQLYKASRPNQDVDHIGLRWEGAYSNFFIRGIMVWDS